MLFQGNPSVTWADFAAQEALLRHNLWRKLKRGAARLPFAEELLAAYYCAFDRDTPAHVKVALIGALAYFVLPFEVIPRLLPLIGFTEEAAVLGTALRLIGRHVQPIHREAARAVLASLLDERA
jgi:uncharacterized membrane protein YkvA (DUF1232 family)